MNIFAKYKKLFLALGFLLIVIAWSYLLYTLFFKSPAPDPTLDPNDPAFTGGLPGAEDGSGNIRPDKEKDNDNLKTQTKENPKKKVDTIARGDITKTTTLVDDPVSNITKSSNGKSLQYYNEKDGLFYKVDKDGNLVKLSDKVFHNVENIAWSPVKNKAVLEYPDGSNIVYDFDNEKQVTLPKHWEEFNFAPTGNQIAFKSIGMDNDSKWLAITSDDGSRSQKIEHIGINADDVVPSWSPNNQSVAMYVDSVGFNRQEIYFVGKNGENFKSTIIEGRGFEPLWTTSGDRLLYSVYSTDTNLKPKLWIVDAKGESIGGRRTDLGIETWAHKCTFAGNHTLYCGVPESLEEGAGPFPEMSKDTNDKLYKIDTNTGLKKLIAIPEGGVNISQIVISEGEKEIFFTDIKNNNIHKIQLK